MDLAIFILVLVAAFGLGLILRLKGVYWLLAWVLATLVVPACIAFDAFVFPHSEKAEGWAYLALLFGTVYSLGLDGFGVFIGRFLARKFGFGAAS